MTEKKAEEKKKSPWELKIEALKKKEIRYQWAFPPQSYHCRYIDLNKSKPHIDEAGKLANRNGLPFWKPANRYIVDVNDFVNLLGNFELDEYVVKCKVCGLELATYFVEKNTVGSEDGILGLKYTQHLLAYRPRMDGLLGLECICGLVDTRLSTKGKLRYPGRFPRNTPTSGYDEAQSRFLVVKKQVAQLIRGKEV